MCPKWFLEFPKLFPTVDFYQQGNSYTAKTKTVTLSRPGVIGGYTPRNKSYLPILTEWSMFIQQRTAAVYKTEDFSSDTMSFTISGIITPDPAFKINPDTNGYTPSSLPG